MLSVQRIAVPALQFFHTILDRNYARPVGVWRRASSTAR